jgi:hypothetical protein
MHPKDPQVSRSGAVTDSQVFAALEALGAGDFAHLNGTLMEHFIGVHDLLREWSARTALCRAGLFHAAYGTAGFEAAMVDRSRRSEIVALLGQEVEQIVYAYCACDRARTWEQIGRSTCVRLVDRFVGVETEMTDADLRDFCELTAANELQIAIANPGFRNDNREFFVDLFERMRLWLSDAAQARVAAVFASANAKGRGASSEGRSP